MWYTLFTKCMEVFNLNDENEKYIRLTESPIRPLITKLAVPTIISMLVTTFYNMADTFFVGKIEGDSTSATGAVGVVFSLMAIIQAVGFFFGHGSGNYISRRLGAGDSAAASVMASVGFYSSFIFGIIFAVFGIIFINPLAYALGSTDTILPYTRDYLRIILLGAPFMTSSLVLNNQLRFQGSAFYGMVGIVSGAVINIALDPLLIFVFDMGISGAAAATVISQFFSFLLLFIGCRKGGNLRVSLKNFKPSGFLLGEIVRGGLPSLLRQSLASVATICLNTLAGFYGDSAIAAFSVVSRILNFAASAIIGFGQGFQPVCGFNYGAKKYDRVKSAFFFSVKVCSVFAVLMSVFLFVFADKAVALFQNDPDVVKIGTAALRAQCLSFPVTAWIVMSNMMMQNINRVIGASFLAMARQGLFFIPAAFLLNFFFGLSGLICAAPVADFAALLCAIPMQLRVLKNLNLD